MGASSIGSFKHLATQGCKKLSELLPSINNVIGSVPTCAINLIIPIRKPPFKALRDK